MTLLHDVALMVLGYSGGNAYRRWRAGWYTRYSDARRMRQTGWWQR